MGKLTGPDFTAPLAQPFFLEGGEHAVLLIHGFTGSAAHMRMVGDGLHQAGFTVQGINLPGHATSPEDMKSTGWADWLGAARDAMIRLKEQYRFASVAGLSMGGVISMILAEEGLPASAVTISAPMAVQNKLMSLAGILAPLYPQVSWGEGTPLEKLKDPRYDLGYSGFPTKCAADLSKLIRMARKNLHQAACPVLTIQSHTDDAIAPDSAQVIQKGIASKLRQTLWLDGVPHVCTITREAPVIVRTMAEFLHKAEREVKE